MIQTISMIQTIEMEPLGLGIKPTDPSIHGGVKIRGPNFDVTLINSETNSPCLTQIEIKSEHPFLIEKCLVINRQHVEITRKMGGLILIGTKEEVTRGNPRLTIKVKKSPRALTLLVSAEKKLKIWRIGN